MTEFIVWVIQPTDENLFEQAKRGIVVSAETNQAARESFATATGLRPIGIRCVSKEKLDSFVARKERVTKAQTKVEQQTGELQEVHLDLRYTIANKTRTVREWIAAAVEAEYILKQVGVQMTESWR